MNIEELKNRFETVANEDVDIATFIFDDLSAINKNRQKKYPVVLMTAPQSTITPFSSDFNTPIWENFKVTFHLLKTWTTEDKKTKSLDQVYRECDAIADKYLKNILAQGGNEYSLIGNKSVTKTREHHQHIDQLVGAQYDFTLRVFNSLCYGLDQPTNLTAAVITGNQIDLSWTDNATSETGYEVWRSTDLINYTLAASTAADSTSYNDIGLTAGTIYHYKVRAFDANGGGIWSNVVYKICLSGIAYDRNYKTQQTTSYAVYDDAWHLANGTYDNYTASTNPISFAAIDWVTDPTGWTLKENNAFGNLKRFTDVDGNDPIENFSTNYSIDHFTGLGHIWSAYGTIIKSYNDWFGVGGGLEGFNTFLLKGWNDWFSINARMATNLNKYEVIHQDVPYIRTAQRSLATSTTYTSDPTKVFYWHPILGLYYSLVKTSAQAQVLTRIHYK